MVDDNNDYGESDVGVIRREEALSVCAAITTLGQSPAGEDGPSISITPMGEFNFALALCESAKVELHRSAFCIIPHTFCS